MTISERRKTLLYVKMGDAGAGVATWLLVLGVTTLFAQQAAGAEPRVVCYYTNWSVYRPGTARFNPQNINPYLCTHLIYAFGGFTKDNTLKPFDKYQDIEKGGYAKFTGLKTYNTRLKTLLAIGGWNEGSTRFSPMVASRERRKEFVRNAIKFLRQNRFDGLDLDWEYPAFRDGGKPKDRDNYARLVRELREEFEKEAEKTGKTRLLLTMAVPAGIEYIQKGFDVKSLNQHLDWMNLLTYDYHSAFEPAVNHHAPLYPIEEPNEYSVDNELNIDYTIQYYLENGADRDKLVLGIPTYGRSYTLFNPDATELGAPADGPGDQGDATREKGYLAYYEICESLQAKPKQKKKKSIDKDDEDSEDEEEEEEEEEEDLPWTVVHPNPQAMGPVAYRGNQWVGYDDLDIVKKKAEYVAEKGLGGIMFWSIDNDDFRGNCHGKPYPLIEAAKESYINKLGITDNAITNEKQSSSSSSRRRSRPRTSSTTAAPATRAAAARKKASAELKSTTPAWSYSTPEPPTTPDPGSDFKCTDEGFFQHPRDCKKYFWCLDSGPSNLGIVAHAFTCPSGLYFNKGADSCDFARNVYCKKQSATTTSTTSSPRTSSATTRAPAATTTRRANKLTSKNSAFFRTTTTTTSSSPLDEDEVYEDDIVEDVDTSDVESEDPKVIKELVDLIKKAGGVEQLERFLKLSDSPAAPSGTGTTTALPISKKLYQRVLEQTRQGGKNSFLDRYNSVSRDSKSSPGQNSRPAPQNEGLENVPEAISVRKERPQYTTINRSRPSSATTEEAAEESVEDTDTAEDEPPETTARVRASDSRPLPQYVNIRRARPSTPPPSDSEDDSGSRNALFERNDASFVSTVSEFPPPQPSPSAGRRDATPEYVTIRRSRPTTAEPTTAKYQSIEREKPVYEEPEEEVTLQPVSAALQYSTVQRTRAPATTSTDEPLTSPSPTTVLSVQISSLLNSPVTSPPEPVITEATLSEPEPTVLLTPEPNLPTTVTDPPTTTFAALSSAITRRTILKRIRSTTTTTAAPSTSAAPQVSSERNYNIIRRRRPNEISSDSDLGFPRKIRSTTPDSRETPGDVRSDGEVGLVSRGDARTRGIRPSTVSEDSVASAAAPISRGRFRPAFSRDEVVSLTPADDETPEFVPLERIAPRPERRFRPRNRPVTPSDSAPDAEASAATVEVRRPEFVPRGRNRFSVSTTTQAASTSADITSTEEGHEKRLTFSRFTPRPFSRFVSTAPSQEEAVLSDTIPNESEDIAAATPRTSARLPIGRTRYPIATPRSIVPQARIVSPLLRRPSFTTALPTDQNIPEDDTEEKNDDIHLSESTIEEKEHDHAISEEPEPHETPRRRIIIKKIRTNAAKDEEPHIEDTAPTSENDINASAVTPGDDLRRRKFKVIRRRPAVSTASVADNTPEEPVTEPLSPESSSVSPTAHRVRKIIRKKILHTPELTTVESDRKSEKRDDQLSVVLNYGDKARPTDLLVTTEKVTEYTPPEVYPIPNNEAGKNEVVTENVILVKEEILDSPVYNSDTNNFTSSETPTGVDDSEVARKKEEEIPPVTEINDSQLPEETSPSSTLTTATTAKSKFARPTYRPPKRLFTQSTEASVSLSSRSYSRKYNAGTYTSSVTPDRETPIRAVTRRPLFTSKPFVRRPLPARTTKKIEADYEEEEPEVEEELDEPEAQLVLVPDNKLFSRGGRPHVDEEEDEDLEESDNPEHKISEEEKQDEFNKPSSRRPFFRPKQVNASTFRSSTTTTEIPKRQFTTSQNRSSIYNASRSVLNSTKKRTQNVPVGYNSPNNTESGNTTQESEETQVEEKPEEEAIETTTNTVEAEEVTTENEDYLTATFMDTFMTSEKTDIISTNTVFELATATEQMEGETIADDYLESTQYTQEPLVLESTTESQHIFSEIQTEPSLSTVQSSHTSNTESNNELKPEAEITTTIAPEVAPVVKTHLDKLFSVSRVVEVSSKLDKHKVNINNNESRLVETGKVMQEKKPTIDRIGEVSRFTLIKIVKDDIPIYLTKLGHEYPVANPPNNPIRIDEGRNARALMNFTDAGRENLVASESVNEAYRHINKLGSTTKVNSGKSDQHAELLKEQNFEANQNAEDRIDKSPAFSPYPMQWQFVPAAYENDVTKEKHNKVAKSFEVITPRTSKTDPSTIALEGLFKTENPLLITARKFPEEATHSPGIHQPFVVYAAPRPVEEEPANIVKLQVLKPNSSGRSVKTYVRGEELSGLSAIEEATVKYPVSISILHSETERDDRETLTTTNLESSTNEIEENHTTVTEQTTPGLTTYAPTTDDLNSTITAAETSTELEVTTTKVVVSSDSLVQNAKKRPKLTFPRRPNYRTANFAKTSASPSAGTLPRVLKKSNSTSALKSLKVSGFNPIKSRFSASRSQNVPVDARNEQKTSPGSLQRQSSTPASTGSGGDSSRKLQFVKPIRPNLLRPAFVPRRASTQPTTQVSDDT